MAEQPRYRLAVVLLALMVLGFFLASMLGQGGNHPRDAVQQVYQSSQQIDTVRELARMDQHITDLEKRIDVHRTEIDQMDPVKTNNRIALVEEYVRRDEQQKREADSRWSEAMTWLRGIGMLIAAIGVNTTYKHFVDQRRHVRSDRKIDTLTKQTDGMSERIDSLSREEGIAEGHKEEREHPTKEA